MKRWEINLSLRAFACIQRSSRPFAGEIELVLFDSSLLLLSLLFKSVPIVNYDNARAIIVPEFTPVRIVP